MPPQQHLPNPLTLTLIVATTPIPPLRTTTTGEKVPCRLGIGQNGTLPWPRIKADMSFFARVTSRAPRAGTTNAIVMGRKTYDSVPRKLRPLGKRINVVVTRDVSGTVKEGVLRELEAKRAAAAAAATAAAANTTTTTTTSGSGGQETDAVVGSGLEEALDMLEKGYAAEGKLGSVFVIGGAEIYAAALRLGRERPVRIVVTEVEKTREEDGPFECDTFFPVDEELVMQKGWRKAGAKEVSEWVGENVEEGWKEEGEVKIQMVGYERLL
ncbi:dihydrofolate reductase [Aspergillus nanangensis]|uniref:Dihydrofolate reductase n=1 Tax=Aspergillus nanangensis TaxID=2582783 RepID=A0AAD4GY54_ASPNN|nr:dihydrofolate reductase [Aspergillus nanangensis]